MEVINDQHFLEDVKILDKETEISEISAEDRVIEVGAGTGNLTRKLVEAGKVLSFEIDETFKPKLEQLKQENKNLEIIYGNALDYSWRGFNKLVSNIPYSLSEPLVLKAIKEGIQTLVLIVSSSFKDVLMTDSKLGIISSLFYKIKVISEVPRTSFNPIPDTDSYLIRLKAKEKTTKSEKFLINLISRQGKIKNAILYSLVSQGKTKNQAREIISKLNLYPEILNKPVEKLTGKLLLKLKELV